MDIANAQLDQDKEHREQERLFKEQELKVRQDEAAASRKSHQDLVAALLAVMPGSQAGAAGAHVNPVCQMDQNQVRDIVHGHSRGMHTNFRETGWSPLYVLVANTRLACMHSKPPTA